ncbi:hypothetical protein L6R53_01745 [Myxococcota bacterium]|nr:hypothetical protein [Myxococcota bacterium]
MLPPLALLLACTTSPPAPPATPPAVPSAASSPDAPAPAPASDPAGALPSSWRRLTSREGRLVDYRWCNADPVEVHLPEPGQDQVRWQWGQEEEVLAVRGFTRTEGGARWEVDRGGAVATITLTWTDPARGLATIGLAEPVGDTFVAMERLADFPSEAEQHCDEL